MKLVCMGDSLTEGYQIDLSKRWTEELKKVLDIDVINSGICGDTTNGMLARFKAMVIDYQPTHVLIMGGTNDVFVGASIANIKCNLLAMTRYARHHDIKAIIGLPTPYYVELMPKEEQTQTEKKLSEKIEHMRQEIRNFVLEDGLPLIDFLEGMTMDLFLQDGCHPNEKGHYQMMLAVKRYIESEIL